MLHIIEPRITTQGSHVQYALAKFRNSTKNLSKSDYQRPPMEIFCCTRFCVESRRGNARKPRGLRAFMSCINSITKKTRNLIIITLQIDQQINHFT